MEKLYYQIQYQAGEVHSDGCVNSTSSREYLHQLLDEFLDAAEEGKVIKGIGEPLEGDHFFLRKCCQHN